MLHCAAQQELATTLPEQKAGDKMLSALCQLPRQHSPHWRCVETFYTRVSVCYPKLDKPATMLLIKVKEKRHIAEEMPGCQGDLENTEQSSSNPAQSGEGREDTIRAANKIARDSTTWETCNGIQSLSPPRLLVLIRSLSKITKRFLATDGWCVDSGKKKKKMKRASVRLDSDIIAQYTHLATFPFPSSVLPAAGFVVSLSRKEILYKIPALLLLLGERRQSTAEVDKESRYRRVL